MWIEMLLFDNRLLSNKSFSTPLHTCINGNISFEGILKHRKYRCDSFVSFCIYHE